MDLELPKEIAHIKKFQGLVGLWQSLRENGAIPKRHDFSLPVLKSYASEIVLYDYISPTEIRYRLIGSDVSGRHDVPFEGVNIFQQIPDEFLGEALEFWTNMHDTPCGGHVCIVYEHEVLEPRISQLLVLPIRDEKRDINQFIGMLDYKSPPLKHDEKGLVPCDYVEVSHTRQYIDAGFGRTE